MPAFTLGGTTYPCRRFHKTLVQVAVHERTFGDTLVSSRATANSTVASVDVHLRKLTEAEKDTVVGLLEAVGTVSIAGDLAGGTLTVLPSIVHAQPLDRQSRWEVEFLADVVDP